MKKKPINRKSIALDVQICNMLQDICNYERRSKIGQLQVMIEREHSLMLKKKNEKNYLRHSFSSFFRIRERFNSDK